MRPEIRDRWAGALESGEYKQGTGLLHEVVDGVDQFCCLGVLCELAIQDGVPVERAKAEDRHGEYPYYQYGVFQNATDLPHEVMKWAGVTRNSPYIGRDDRNRLVDAIKANDDINWSFNRIAGALRNAHPAELT